jgi:FkbM family methyltransferase
MRARIPQALVHLAHHLWLGIRPRDPARRRFLLDKSRLALRHDLGLRDRRARVLDYEVEFLDRDDFRRLLDEVFGSRIYAFAPRREAPLILDLGANIGMSVLFFKHLAPASRIVAFEPDPASFAVLERNVGANRVADVTLVPAAVGASAGTIDLYADRDGRHSLLASTLPHRAPAATARRVPAVALSAYVGEEVDLLKIDIEGAEEGVLRELAGSGRLTRVHEMHIEYHHHVTAGEDRLAGFLGLLEGAGFGYQIAANRPPPEARDVFQDLMVHAYRKPAATSE